MRHESVIWVGGFLIGFFTGLALSLLYTWVIDPPALTDTTPTALNPHDKEIYTVLVATAHVAEGDLERTTKRLAELEDPDIQNTIIVLAERYINEGRDARDIRALARLSDALGGTSAAMRPFIASPTPAPTFTPTPTPPTPTRTRVVPVTPTPTPTVTPPPRRTPTSNSSGRFVIAQSTALCDPTSDGLLRVYVRDASGKGLPGIPILVSWPTGEDRFFTGFKPDVDPGYADFEMQPDEDYQVQLVDRESETAQQVGAGRTDICPDLPSGVQSSWQIVFQIGQ